MSSHRKRFETIHAPRLIEAMRVCRDAALEATRTIRPQCETDREVQAMVAAIDRLAGHLTGDPTIFHLKPHGMAMTRREG